MDKIRHYFFDAIAANGYIWLLEANMGALFKMNITTFELEFVTSLPAESNLYNLYRFSTRCGNKLVCYPRNARDIVVYDIISGNMEIIELNLGKHKGEGTKMYGDMAVGGKVYLSCQGHSEIYQLDVQSGELLILNIVNNKIEERGNSYFWHNRIRKYKNDAEIIAYNLKHNAFYQYNTLTSETKKLICFDEKQKLIDFVTDDHFIWGLFSDGRLYKLDESQIIEEFQCDMAETDVAELLYFKGCIYVIDGMTGKVISSLKIGADKREDISEKIPINSTGLFCNNFNGDDYFWLQWNDGLFYYYDGENEVSGIFEGNLEKIPATAFIPKGKLIETKRFPLSWLLQIVKYQPRTLENHIDNKAGTSIYTALLRS